MTRFGWKRRLPLRAHPNPLPWAAPSRKACDRLQGLQVYRHLGGAAGAGLGSTLLQDLTGAGVQPKVDDPKIASWRLTVVIMSR